MLGNWWIYVIVILFIIVSIIILVKILRYKKNILIKKLGEKRDEEIIFLNQKEYSELDKFSKIMNKIIENDSFKISYNNEKSQEISYNNEKSQLIEMDLNVVIPEQKNYVNFNEIDEEHSSFLYKFATFLIKENNQFPIFKFGEDEALVAFAKEDDNKKIDIFHVTELEYFRESAILKMIENSNSKKVKQIKHSTSHTI